MVDVLILLFIKIDLNFFLGIETENLLFGSCSPIQLISFCEETQNTCKYLYISSFSTPRREIRKDSYRTSFYVIDFIFQNLKLRRQMVSAAEGY